jgi:sugar phosphate isomerase/epimerase
LAANIYLGTAPGSWGVWSPEDPVQTPWERFLDELAAAGYEWLERFLEETDPSSISLCLDAGHISYCGGDLFAIVEQDMYPCDPDTPLPIARRTRAYPNSCGFGAI